MYAARRFRVRNWQSVPKEKRFSVKVTCGGQPLKAFDSERVSVIEEDVMYWRKANHIHAWFVDNVQDGIDNGGSYYVSEDKLRELLSVCLKVIAASKLVEGMDVDDTTSSSGDLSPVPHCAPCRVIEDPTVAKQLLPTRSGFFFGSAEYNEDYLDAVKSTRGWAVRMLSDLRTAKVASDISYSSSW